MLLMDFLNLCIFVGPIINYMSSLCFCSIISLSELRMLYNHFHYTWGVADTPAYVSVFCFTNCNYLYFYFFWLHNFFLFLNFHVEPCVGLLSWELPRKTLLISWATSSVKLNPSKHTANYPARLLCLDPSSLYVSFPISISMKRE